MNGYIKKNGNKYLTIAITGKSKDALKKKLKNYGAKSEILLVQ